MSEKVLTVQATDIDSMRDAVNAASHSARSSWFGFLSLTAYFFVAVASVTHRDLLLNSPMSLPLFRVDVPLDLFFLFTPMAYVAVQFGVLVQHVLLTQKAVILHRALAEEEAGSGEGEPDERRFTLDSYFITQAVAGPARRTLLAFFLDNMTWLSLVIVPVLLLIAFQITFLPYHDLAITWSHRLVLAVDLVMIVFLGAYLGAPELRLFAALKDALGQRPVRLLTALTIAFVAAFFSWLVATVPGEGLDRTAQAIGSARMTHALFEGEVDPITGRSTSLFQRNLIVTDADLVPDDPNRSPDDRTLSLRGRDLRFATLDRTDLQGADLTGANLQRAQLQGTRLTDAVLTAADLRGALFWREGQQDVDFAAARLDGASFRRARLDSANLHGVEARGADFSGARLIGATFLNADLAGADFQAANLVAVGFAGANLDAARFKGAQLDAARFERARLVGADLSNVALIGVDLAGADLSGADLRGGPVWATRFPDRAAGLDTSYRIATMPGDEHMQWLHKEIATAWTPDDGIKLRANASALMDAGGLKSWEAGPDFAAWSQLQSAPAWSPVNAADLTTLLIDNACGDGTPRAVVARGIARRASETFLFSPQFNGDPARLHEALLKPDCKDVAARLPAEALQELNRARRLAKQAQEMTSPLLQGAPQ